MVTDVKTSLLADVVENPGDDAPRLVYADWLEEYGDERDRLRAEFIRVQIAIAAQGDPRRSPAAGRDNDRLQGRLSGRERELLWPARAFSLEGISDSMPLGVRSVLSPYCHAGVLYRGFVDTVIIRVAVLRSEVIPIFSTQPILGVTLCGSRPANVRRRSGGLRCWAWFKESSLRSRTGPHSDPANLPPELFPEGRSRVNFKYYREAKVWLSAACVAWGRREAGLPEYPIAATREVPHAGD